jgi:diamine N-acetyltransferase
MIEISPAASADSEALTALARKTYSDAFGASMHPADLKAHLDRHLSLSRVRQMLAIDAFLVARQDESLIGFVQFGAVQGESERQFPPGAIELRRLYVLAEHQNCGLGARLMEAALGVIDSKGVPAVILDVWEDNDGAKRFYERYGFSVCGERPFHVESGASAGVDLLMIRRRDSTAS